MHDLLSFKPYPSINSLVFFFYIHNFFSMIDSNTNKIIEEKIRSFSFKYNKKLHKWMLHCKLLRDIEENHLCIAMHNTTKNKIKKQSSSIKCWYYKFLEIWQVNLYQEKIAFTLRQLELQNLRSGVQFFSQAKLSSCDAR
jgi:hypothetical protein